MNTNIKTFMPETIERIKSIIGTHPDITRSELSRNICQLLDWRGANGNLKDMSCRVALLKLERQGLINLPVARQKPPIRSYGRSERDRDKEEVSAECTLMELGDIEIEVVDSAGREKSRLWNLLMNRYHYLGAGPLCGAQIRYFIRSSHCGIIGGLAFSAAAWSLESRDNWIGWDDEARRKHLNQVICNSRFLIVPTVRVKNLASHVLSVCMKRLRADWQKRYGIEPLAVETFVDTRYFKGTCYKAGNWIKIGQTKGRGRQDRGNKQDVGIKDIYMYLLSKDAKGLLNEGRERGIGKQACRKVLPADWAEEEFGKAQLQDERRVKRLLTIARDFWAHPEANIPQASGSRAKTKAAYRFFENKEHTMEKILAPHYKSVIERASREKVVLAVQDTTELNYSTHPATQDLGLIGTHKDGAVGLIVHDTMCFNEEGTPLGLVDVQVWARDPADFGKRELRKELGIEQKESNKWLKSFKAVTEAQRQCRDTTFISVGDREADIYELFVLAQDNPQGPKLLIRSRQDRLMVDGQVHLWEYVASQPISGIREVRVPRKNNKPGRDAKLGVRFAQVTLTAPKAKSHLKDLEVWAVLAEEIECPEVETPLRWMLLTTLTVETFEQADKAITLYCKRWGIEIYHKTLKSGCKIEQRQLGSADRIEACLGIDMVIAWRVYHLVKLGREIPDMPCTVFFEDSEWKALVAYKTKNPIPPAEPPKLREAMHIVASLGGFLGRKSDGEPGTQTLWLGIQRLDDITAMWKISIAYFAPQHLKSPVSSVPHYG